MMPPRRTSQRLHPYEGLPQASNQNQPPFQQPSTQTLPTITEAAEHPSFGNILEAQPQQANMLTTIVGTSQTSRGDQHLNTNLPPLPQVNQDKAELNQIKVQDWDEAEEDEVDAEKNKLIWVQQEIERLRQEQESIMRRQVATQRAEAHRQHINRERVRLAELQYTIDILHQQEQQQDPLLA
jgi:broad specificity polyphosphatase/5'/3'-nucleotidase SurE